MKRKTILFLLAAMLLQTISFSQTNPLIKYLPEDVSMVVNLDLMRLAGKIPAETFQKSFIYRELMKDPNKPFTSLLIEAYKSGVDFSSGILVAVKGNQPGQHGQPAIHIFGKLRDAELFTATIKKITKDKEGSIETYGTDRILFFEMMTAGWNNDVFVITSGHSNELREEFLANINSSDTLPGEAFDTKKLMEKIRRSQRDLCFQLLTKKTQNSFAVNERVTDLLKTEGDIKVWSTGAGNPISENMIPLAGILMGLQEFLAGTKTGVINFEEGKIVAKSNNYLQGELAALYKKYPPTPASQEFIRRLPNGKLLGLMNFSFSSEMINEVLQKKLIREIWDSLHSKMPFDLKKLQGVFQQKLMLAVVQTDENNSKQGIQLFVAMPIADKLKFQELIEPVKSLYESLKNKKPSETTQDTVATADGTITEIDQSTDHPPAPKLLSGISPTVKYNDELVVLTLSPETADAFLNNPGTQSVPAWMEPYSKYPLLIEVNLQEIVRMQFSKDAPERLGMVERLIFDLFDKIIIYGGEYENESLTSTMEFRFGNPEGNALKQLFEMLNSMTEKNTDGSSIKNKEHLRTDTTEITITEIVQEKRVIEPPPPPPPLKPKAKAQVKKNNTPIKKND